MMEAEVSNKLDFCLKLMMEAEVSNKLDFCPKLMMEAEVSNKLDFCPKLMMEAEVFNKLDFCPKLMWLITHDYFIIVFSLSITSAQDISLNYFKSQICNLASIF
jgi:hypothetical protein